MDLSNSFGTMNTQSFHYHDNDDIQAGRQAGRQADRQTDRQGYTIG